MQHRERNDAIGTEMAIVPPQLAPGADQRRLHVIRHCDRPDGALGAFTLLVNVGDLQLALVADRLAHFRKVHACDDRGPRTRDVDRRGHQLHAQRLRQDHCHLRQYAFSRVLQSRIAGATDQPGSHRDRLDLLGGEHQRRQVEAAPQNIADAGRSIDRHAPRLQRGDVAIDCADRDLQLIGERGSRHRPARRAQPLYDVEQPVSPPHLFVPRPAAACRRGRCRPASAVEFGSRILLLTECCQWPSPMQLPGRQRPGNHAHITSRAAAMRPPRPPPTVLPDR